MRPTKSVRLNLEELNPRLNPATISYSSGGVFYAAALGEANVVAVTNGSGTVTITDTGVGVINITPRRRAVSPTTAGPTRSRTPAHSPS